MIVSSADMTNASENVAGLGLRAGKSIKQTVCSSNIGASATGSCLSVGEMQLLDHWSLVGAQRRTEKDRTKLTGPIGSRTAIGD